MYKWKGVKNELEHRVIAAQVLGRPLKGGECVHHIDGNGANNAHDNLVICPSHAYHMMLHTREKALNECGNPNLRKCYFCGEYDEVGQMYKPSNRETSYRHRHCFNAYRREHR